MCKEDNARRERYGQRKEIFVDTKMRTFTVEI